MAKTARGTCHQPEQASEGPPQAWNDTWPGQLLGAAVAGLSRQCTSGAQGPVQIHAPVPLYHFYVFVIFFSFFFYNILYERIIYMLQSTQIPDVYSPITFCLGFLCPHCPGKDKVFFLTPVSCPHAPSLLPLRRSEETAVLSCVTIN